MTGANLTGAKLTSADLTGADLRGARLYNADLTGTDLTGADLRGTTLTGAELDGANLSSANPISAGMVGLALFDSRHGLELGAGGGTGRDRSYRAKAECVASAARCARGGRYHRQRAGAGPARARPGSPPCD